MEPLKPTTNVQLAAFKREVRSMSDEQLRLVERDMAKLLVLVCGERARRERRRR